MSNYLLKYGNDLIGFNGSPIKNIVPEPRPPNVPINLFAYIGSFDGVNGIVILDLKPGLPTGVLAGTTWE